MATDQVGRVELLKELCTALLRVITFQIAYMNTIMGKLYPTVVMLIMRLLKKDQDSKRTYSDLRQETPVLLCCY